ncbi:hypothetical protein SSBR45G_70470 [Bradyrhizobium sp. SSBR45G]|uniref:hypothetical protein n=1 Tax=unclassified Bradyrhizobium TaxID=2631580 RepID=UPI002342B2B0|nr:MULTISPECIES: hypothetical protein [unclassified Bradyrhizobium]GLH82138.1 hypothetical protein SSBR45G_70470 [Bradyrhizobium sp. SSBR45G]GLH89575.1 hypothetical protein SSBR45R_70360 [Bradyrhizobium sp. SSBR45R]
MVSFQEFSRFVRHVTRYGKPISPETDVVHDLGVAGADGEDFARALLETYGLRLTRDEILQHFGEERAMTPWHLLIWLWDQAERLKPLTVRELYDRIIEMEQGGSA